MKQPIIGIHLDLKYAMPRKSYLKQWVAELADHGVNALLLEYEDKFPYQRYPFLADPEAFTQDELRAFLDIARGRGLRLIPFVPTLSHLEHALRHPQLAHLRELPHIPTQIDTSSEEAVQFVFNLLDDVLALHGPDEMIHVGGDEAWHMGWNERTKVTVAEHGVLGTWAIHMKRVLNHVIQRGKRPVMFDDLLWNRESELAKLDLPKQTIFHSWSYGQIDDEKSVSRIHNRLRAYQEAGHQTLGGPCLNWGVVVPRHDHCLGNTRSWAIVCEREAKNGCIGMLNTAWACFHVLPHAQSMQIAATPVMVKDPSARLSDEWFANWVMEWFGVDAATARDAVRGMRLSTAFYEHPIAGLPRPMTPILYGIMDMVIWYRGQDQRRAEGAYPGDPTTVGFDAIFARKLKLFREDPRQSVLLEKLTQFIGELEQAMDALAGLRDRASKHREQADYFAFAPRLKWTHARMVRGLVTGQRDAEAEAAWSEMGEELQRVLTPFVEPMWRDWLIKAWWQPAGLAE